jgi:hypothetical protein
VFTGLISIFASGLGGILASWLGGWPILIIFMLIVSTVMHTAIKWRREFREEAHRKAGSSRLLPVVAGEARELPS